MKNHWYYKFLIVFIIFFGMFFLLTINMSSIVASSGFKNYMNFVSVPFNFFDRYNIFKYKDVLEEKEKLEKKVLILSEKNNKINNLKEENNSLKKIVDIKKLYTDYDIVYSKIVNRNKMYWYSRVTLDKGSNYGLKEGLVVVSSYGLIGVIESVTKDSSVVRLVTNNSDSNRISVATVKGDSLKHGIISDFDYPYLKVELTDSVKGITVGDKVITSGLGNLPKNIVIGEVEKVKKDSYGLTNILYVKPYGDINNIDYVGVLIR